MTKNDWTPGPWVVGTGHGEGWVEIGASGNALKTHGRTKRAQANRALIAAAPELAEALELCTAALENFLHLKGVLVGEMADAHNKAASLLARIRGLRHD